MSDHNARPIHGKTPGMFLKSSLGDKYVNSWLRITKTPVPRRLKQEKDKFKVYMGEQSQSKVSLANRKFLFQNLKRVRDMAQW